MCQEYFLHEVRDRDPEASFDNLKNLSGVIVSWHHPHRGETNENLDHFLTRKLLPKSLSLS